MQKNNWQPQPIDLILSTVIAIGFPFFAAYLYSNTGALLPMTLYYLLAWGICILRRGETGYFKKPLKKPPLFFYVNLIVIISALTMAYFSRIEAKNSSLIGIFLTATIWAVVNAASEQLLWIYIFDSWDLYGKAKAKNSVPRFFFKATGIILFTIFVGLIHIFFWVNFLHAADSTLFFGTLFVILTSLSGYIHIIVWRQSGEMLYTFIPHFLLNLTPIFWTAYSMGPYLVK